MNSLKAWGLQPRLNMGLWELSPHRVPVWKGEGGEAAGVETFKQWWWTQGEERHRWAVLPQTVQHLPPRGLLRLTCHSTTCPGHMEKIKRPWSKFWAVLLAVLTTEGNKAAGPINKGSFVFCSCGEKHTVLCAAPQCMDAIQQCSLLVDNRRDQWDATIKSLMRFKKKLKDEWKRWKQTSKCNKCDERLYLHRKMKADLPHMKLFVLIPNVAMEVPKYLTFYFLSEVNT